MANYPTPHINATPDDFAKTVLMPGDPLRAKRIAETFLQDAKLVNNVRGVQGYTGTYDGVKVSVMASGMGMPSMGIYSWELFNFFDVENIIRIGSAGAIQEHVNLFDILIAQATCTDSNWAKQYRLPGDYAPIASYKLLKTCEQVAEELKLPYHIGNIVSSDSFYGDEDDLPEEQKSYTMWKKMGVLGVEMEAAALYMNAARSGKNALAITTVSDHILRSEQITPEQRQNSFTNMMELALKTAAALEK